MSRKTANFEFMVGNSINFHRQKKITVSFKTFTHPQNRRCQMEQYELKKGNIQKKKTANNSKKHELISLLWFIARGRCQCHFIN